MALKRRVVRRREAILVPDVQARVDVGQDAEQLIEAGLRGPAASREDLMYKARDLWRWRRDILRRSMNDPS